MSLVFEPSTESPVTDQPQRGPAIVLATVAVSGILADRLLPIGLNYWLSLSLVAAVSWCVTFVLQKPWLSVNCLLIGWFSLAGGWHHFRWSCLAADDISIFATDDPRLARVVAKVVQAPWIVQQSEGQRARWQSPEHTSILLDCRSLVISATKSLAVSGQVRCTVNGPLPNLVIGDIVEVTGDLLLPREPANPGDFDQRSFLRAQGVFTILRADFVDCVKVLSRERTFGDWILIGRGFLRSRAEQLIARWLAPETAPVAQAMLLGTRAQIDEGTRRAFRESGMLHILAISGMNVGLLWAWLWNLSRCLGRSSRTSTWIVLIALPVYALVTDASPPIVRATVMALIVAVGQLQGRQSSIGNSLALAGLTVLAWNPNDLFNTGVQLSFLAVFAILHSMNWMALLRQQAMAKSEDAPLPTSFLRGLWRRFSRSLMEANVVGLAIWLLTSPLIASEFHLVSPIGSLLTVLLIPLVTIMFWIGYSFLILGMLWPSPFGWLGWLFDQCLQLFLWFVHRGAELELGHTYVPAPPGWWTFGFYVVTLIPLLVDRDRPRGRSASVRAGLAWMILGIVWDLNRPLHPGLTCTFISVGHGLSVLIECPNGRTALYDAGGMIGGDSIAKTISQTLWVAGRSRLDAVILSHADGDHCNAMPELNRIVPPDGLFVHRSFLDWQQPPVAAAIEQSAGAGAKIRLLSEGQGLVLDPQVSVQVLHPPHDFRSTRDNPNSLVLCLEYAGRRIILTGDLEQEGLDRLLRTRPLDTDVLLAPHHGSLQANTTDLARWSTPEWLIVSTPDASIVERLKDRYGPETQILTTARHGAIRCRVLPNGELRVEPFKKQR